MEFQGSEWQRPVRGGELEQLLCIAYYLANAIDHMLGRCPLMTPCASAPNRMATRLWQLEVHALSDTGFAHGSFMVDTCRY